MIRLPFDREGWKFAGAAAVISLLLGLVSTNMGWVGIIFTICCLLFFRDPERVHPGRLGIIVSPADGIVLKISECVPPVELDLEGSWKKVSIFMSVFDVHVNRTPVKGKVEKIQYIEGKFFNVTLDKASEFNERQAVHMKMDNGVRVIFVQIAGLIARRIRCDIAEGQDLDVGQRVGIIRFGSRVDVYMPTSANILIDEGQVMVAGETVIADLIK